MEVERGRLSYMAACRSLGRFVMGFQAGFEQFFFFFFFQRRPVLTRSPSRLVSAWFVEAQAEWDAAADCLALRISPN